MKPFKGRNSILQSPCLNDTYHDDTIVSRTLPRPGKKLPGGHRSWATDIYVSFIALFSGTNTSIKMNKGPSSRVHTLVQSFENNGLYKVHLNKK